VNWKTTLAICVIILLAAGGVTAVIFSTEPKAKRVTATKKTAMLVEVTEVHRGSYRPTIVALGSVQPARDIVLGPRVSGEILERADAFTPGGFVDEGELLLQIDPSDYETALAQRKSELRQALADLDIEMGRQNVAERDLQLFDGELPTGSRELVLRQPQLDTAKARVDAARAAVERAKLDLGRTTIEAPFDAHILTREANVGSQVAPGDRLGRLVGLDEYWVVTTVPLSKLRWISFPEEKGEIGSKVRVRDRAAWPAGVYREGRIDKLVGALEERTRLAQVLVSVPDPLARGAEAAGEPKLMIGSFVEARIEADPVEDVVRVDRDYLRKDDTVWVMEEGTLRIRDAEILLQDEQHAYLASGLEEGDLVVTTNLSTVTDGAPLRLSGEGAGGSGGEAPAEAESAAATGGS
jgi:RND family efflux transporter MFP subunit